MNFAVSGSASVEVTPRDSMLMIGFGARTELAIGVHSPLTVRALFFQPGEGDGFILVSIDLLGFDLSFENDIRERVRESKNLRDYADRVVVTATHTHAAPCLYRSWREYAGEHYETHLQLACVEAIRKAFENQEPVTLEWGESIEPEIGKNRRHLEREVNREMKVLVVRSLSGNIRSLLVHYACHPTVLGPQNLYYSSDYPGAFREVLERVYLSSVVFLLNGCAGEINLGHTSQSSLEGKGGSLRSAFQVEKVGKLLATTAMRAIEGGKKFEIDRGSYQEIDLSLTYDLKDSQNLILNHSKISLYRFGKERGILFLPHEIFSELGTGIRNIIQSLSLMIVSYCHSNNGYVADEVSWQEGGYEIDQAYLYYQQPEKFSRDSARRIEESIKGFKI